MPRDGSDTDRQYIQDYVDAFWRSGNPIVVPPYLVPQLEAMGIKRYIVQQRIPESINA